ncbi:MAG: Asp23/Gls24 family envelope stress response protein [Ruminococcaceae bacterium]|nr:Asp23/Gls24 family envelope stress response protein [Oscillospiraceae bacterium]
MNSYYDNDESVGKVKISSDVIASIAENATMEIEGVDSVSTANIGIKGMLTKAKYKKPVKIEINDEMAKIEISIVVDQKARIPDLANAIQLNVKNAVQNMTGLTVLGVDVIIAGISPVNGKQK